MTSTEIIVAIIGAVSSLAIAIGGWRAGRKQAAQQARTQDIKGADERWQAMLQEQRSGFEAQLAPMRMDIEDLRGQVSTLRREVHAKDSLIAALSAYLREVLAAWRLVNLTTHPPPPPETIRHLL